ncbi:hypothetical protein [Bacillus sp. B-jedd]|uniref:hypothetical protein n=1 Tax=Bacillus sp. B-jedd TaxID=1476857 RepID=UPI000515702E|nr:hypothetical protein [Bacillus sp. B-jedd]CEG25662.1 hypothetical protein BN1002_00478 [Bacillus sp. B-jedd]
MANHLNEPFMCKKCGHTEMKIGKIGNSGYDKVRKPGAVFSLGTSMLITCCANCGEVDSMRIEDPTRL